MSVKLYRHNESGEVVAAILTPKSYKLFDYTGGSFFECKDCFEQTYTPLPEAPEVGSTAWAWQMLESGEKISHPTLDGGYLYLSEDNILMWSLHNCMFSSITQSLTGWQLYEAPKPIVELLPHEFRHRQKVLVADCVGDFWLLGEFDTYAHGDFEPFRVCEGRAEEGVFGFKYCIPFEGNESLKGSQMQGEHGAVPKGYVPPHVPQLGESGYWEERDPVIDLSTNETYVIAGVDGNTYILSSGRDTLGVHTSSMNGVGFVRKIYHKGSYVREDGTVHEHIPTRPHKIIDTVTDGA